MAYATTYIGLITIISSHPLVFHRNRSLLSIEMTVNTKKTEVIFFGNKSRLKKLDNKTVKYLGTPLERKKEAKYLGVIFDEMMQWSSQISNITKKVNFKLGKIKSVASFLTSHTKKERQLLYLQCN